MPNIKVEPTIPNYPPQGIQAQLDLLYLWNPDVANDLIDQLNKALEEVGNDLDNYLTKAEAAATYATQTEVTQLSGDLEEVSNKVDTVDNDLKELGGQTASIQQDVNTLKTGKVSKTGDTMTGALEFNLDGEVALRFVDGIDGKAVSIYRAYRRNDLEFALGPGTITFTRGAIVAQDAGKGPFTLGNSLHPFKTAYVYNLNNGEDINVPTVGGTLTLNEVNFKTAITDTNKGLTEADAYTKEEVDAKVSSVYRFRGSVATYNDLPTEGNVQGDVWNVEDTGANYAWDGTKWDKLSETVDLTPYLTKEDAASTYATITTVNGKQDALTTEQLAAANSGITSAKVTSYDAYANEISTAQSTADKADGAAEVAQQTANLAGQEAAQALSALAGKVNIAQGADNAGKVMTVGADGNLAPADAPGQQADSIVWDKSIDLTNTEPGQYYDLNLDLGQLTTGHYRVYIKVMLSAGLIDNEGNELFLPYTTVAEFYYDATNNSAYGTASPVLDTHTVLNNEMSIPTTETMILLSMLKTATGNVLFWSGGSQYYSIYFQKETTLHDAFQVSKITNMDTGEEFSAQSLSYNTGESPADAIYLADLSYYGVNILAAQRSTKTIELTPGGSAIYGVISDNNWIFINPTQEAQYAAVSQIGMEPGLGEFLVCICEQNMSTLAIGDMAVFKLFLSPTKAEYERISATGKFANLKPFIEKTDSSATYSGLTFRNYDWSEIQISSESQLVCFTSYYGAMTPTAFALSPLDHPIITSTDIYEVPEKESAQALPDQTGNAGKFLKTDGTSSSWEEGINVSASYIGVKTSTTQVGVILNPVYSSFNFNAQRGVFIGLGAQAIGSCRDAIAIGDGATVSAAGAMQFGYGANTEAGSVCFALSETGYDAVNYKLLDSAGIIPAERLAAGGTAGDVLTRTATGAEWSAAPSSAITTDATLTGSGTADSPLGIAQSVQDSIDTKLPLAGGEFTNGADVILPGTLRIINEMATSQYFDITCEDGTMLTFKDNNGYGVTWNMHAIKPLKTKSMDLGSSTDQFVVAYIKSINNGADIAIPTTGGTMALTSDITAATGVATLLYYDSTQAPDHSHAMSGVSLDGYGLAGYEVYSNGYVRQWGQDSTSTGTTLVTLPISYTAATTVSMSFFVSVTEVAAAPTGQISAIPVAANQFQVDKPSAICNWETSGYITLS